ncbi:hypothetical protein [Hwangdonia lutea]|uniref:Uncharacterized protein n=1 Tax=Hwangdonia lutea TaxID=3075823 RepID=A0AA97HRS2_9FLAO|nr:hypothetical protein [Hwangdonia sp. SCSIO 19198]WOD45121.1 hypothetical protein RNZ46_07590 [Hwangdonia sp. SCSIO 19198]
MKKLILLILILIITPFLITSEKSINEKAIKISVHNSKLPETANWEYVKMKVFDVNGKLEKGYDKPVQINLDRSATHNDSIIVSNFF